MRLVALQTWEHCVLARQHSGVVYVILWDNYERFLPREDTPFVQRMDTSPFPIARLTYADGYCADWELLYGHHIRIHQFPPFTGWSKGRLKYWLKEDERMTLFSGTRNLEEKTLIRHKDLCIVDEDTQDGA